MQNLSYFKSADDKEIALHKYEPSGSPKGAIVLVYEIFGFTKHIEAMAIKLTELGYTVAVPDIFSRIEKNIILDYNQEGIDKGKSLKNKLGFVYPVMDIISCGATLKLDNNVGLIGYCYGGSLVWRTIQKSFLFDSAISFYGSDIIDFLDLKVNTPTHLHFGVLDESIKKDTIKKIKGFIELSKSNAEIFLYEDSEHGFNCEDRNSYNEVSSQLSFKRCKDFLKNTLDNKE